MNHKLLLIRTDWLKYGKDVLEFLLKFSKTAFSYKVDVVVVHGIERYTGQSIKILYIGSYRNYVFLFARICIDYRVITRHSAIDPLHTKKWIKKYRDDVDLLFIDIEFPYNTLLGKEGFIAIPQWVKQKLRIEGTWDNVVNSLPRKTRRETFRHLKKFGFTYSITRAQEDLKNFYHQMYVPYIRKKFKDESIIVDEKKFLKESQMGELLQLIHGNQVISGALLQKVGRQLNSVWVGYAKEIDTEAVKGTSEVLDYFTILYGHKNGCQIIDFGPSRPLLNDGVFRYKSKWGTYVCNSLIPTGDILLKPLHLNGPVRSFLARNPVIARDGYELAVRVLFVDRTVNREDLKTMDMNHPKGVYRIKVFSLAGFDDDAYRWAVQHNDMKLVDLSGIKESAEAYCRL